MTYTAVKSVPRRSAPTVELRRACIDSVMDTQRRNAGVKGRERVKLGEVLEGRDE